MTTKTKLWRLVGVAGVALACGPGAADREQPVAAHPDHEIARPTPRARAGGDWRERVSITLAQLAEDDPVLLERLRTLEPARTRPGSLRFTDPIIHDPRAAAVMLDRLAAGEGDPALRLALAEALWRTGGDYGEATVALLEMENDPAVRQVLVAGLRRCEPGHALLGVRLGLADPDPGVRAGAATAASSIARGSVLGDELVALVHDQAAIVRAAAARSLGVLEVAEGFAPLASLLEDADAEVRLQAVHALERIDAASAARLPRMQALGDDPDERVARAATQLAAARP